MAIRIYGATDWGRLARFYVLDTRQYRSVQVCPAAPTAERCDFAKGRKILFGGAGGANFIDPNEAGCKAALSDESRTVLGEAQEQWLDGALDGERRGLEHACTERAVDDRGRGHGRRAATVQ